MDRELTLLGPPRAREGGTWRPLAVTRPNALLAFVALRGGPVRHDEESDRLLSTAQALAARLGLAWPPEAAPPELDDAGLLERVEALLGGARSASA